jgi:hypothetical protein
MGRNMKITNGKEVLASIVIPSDATVREKFAANEMARYISKISGFDIKIETDDCDMSENMILIGGPERNAKTAVYISSADFECEVSGTEGFMIRSFEGNALLLAGSNKDPDGYERGTIYAVYEFLERFLGCSFVAYGKKGTKLGEYIPKTAYLETGEILYVKSESDIKYRAAIVQFDGYAHEKPNADAYHDLVGNLIDWMAKNRINRILFMLSTYELIKTGGMLDDIRKRGIELTVGHHDSGMFFLPPEGNERFKEKYYETHPEYFRLQEDGTRFFPADKWKGQLVYDMRNQGAIRQFADNIISWIEENPYVDTVTIWPNDGDDPQCVCDDCRDHSKMTNYSYFVNEIAKLVNKRYSNIKLDMIVYLDLWEPPEDIGIGSGVVVEVATWGPNYILRPFGRHDRTGLTRTGVEDNAIAWSKKAGKIAYYDYYMTNFSSNQVYCPMANEIIEIYESLKEKGYCIGSGTQMEAYNIWNYLFNFYVHGRKAYDTSLTFDDLAERFIRIFGKGGRCIYEYLDHVERVFEGKSEKGTESAAYFISNVDKDKVYELFEMAYAAEPEGIYGQNIKLLRMAFRYSDLQHNDPGCDELLYMSENFGSYWGTFGQTGYGIAVFDKPGSNSFVPDHWYKFG